MSKTTIPKETEEKRLRDFQMIAENWDRLPEYAQGKFDGIISATASFFGESDGTKKAG